MCIRVKKTGTALELFTRAAGQWALVGCRYMMVIDEVHTEIGAGLLYRKRGYEIFLLCSLRGTAL